MIKLVIFKRIIKFQSKLFVRSNESFIVPCDSLKGSLCYSLYNNIKKLLA